MSGEAVRVRTEFTAADIAAIIRLHADLYTREFNFDETFLDHVSSPLLAFARTVSPRDRLWVAERYRQVVGSVAIVQHEPTIARLRWFLVDPEIRGIGLGRQLLDEGIAFSKVSGYASIILWTVSQLAQAAKLYRAAGFRKVREQPGRMGGVDVIEEMYELNPIA